MATNSLQVTSSPTTQSFFDNYYSQSIPVDSAIYDRVLTFFKSKTTSTLAAEQLTQTVIALTYKNKLDPIAIINDFDKAANSSELKPLFITFFNSLRNPTSKIGFGNPLKTNQWIQRNIIQ